SVGDLLFAVNLTRIGIYQSVNIFIPPDFTGLSSTTQVWTSFTNDYNPNSLRLLQVGSTDSVAPNWWEIQIQNIRVTLDRSNDPSQGDFVKGTTQYVRLFAVTSPSIAGRYFFKVFLNGTSIGAKNFPTLVVKASKDPAYISGVLRYAEDKDPSLIGTPIQLRPGEGAW